jgi:two-component system response regulator DesR
MPTSLTAPKPTPGKPRCVIVEDHLMFRELLGALLEAEGLVEVVAVARTAREGSNACELHLPDLLLLDLSLPGGNGVAVARTLAKYNPAARTIIVSGEADTFRCPPALKSQVYSIVDKTRAFSILRSEVASLVRQLGSGDAVHPETSSLSPREIQVFELVGLGLTSKEIGDRLKLSYQTVETHRRRIGAKLGISSSALVSRAAIHNLTSRIQRQL